MKAGFTATSASVGSVQGGVVHFPMLTCVMGVFPSGRRPFPQSVLLYGSVCCWAPYFLTLNPHALTVEFATQPFIGMVPMVCTPAAWLVAKKVSKSGASVPLFWLLLMKYQSSPALVLPVCQLY